MYWYQIVIPIIKEVRQTIHTDANQNASLITADFLAMVYKNEQSLTAYLCRGWARLENDFNLICRWCVIMIKSHMINVHMTRFSLIAYIFDLILLSVYA